MPYEFSLPPITVIVSDGRYNCFGEPTERNLEMMRILKEDLGGIADSVPDGVYHFNVEVIEGTTAYCSLDPA